MNRTMITLIDYTESPGATYTLQRIDESEDYQLMKHSPFEGYQILIANESFGKCLGFLIDVLKRKET